LKVKLEADGLEVFAEESDDSRRNVTEDADCREGKGIRLSSFLEALAIPICVISAMTALIDRKGSEVLDEVKVNIRLFQRNEFNINGKEYRVE